ncbi:hypothetical protein V6x_19070 [Gimesia chilikensis]|uniref:Uncharacterized protein n=1 Tax=Gimesia chilikensis TaxID=2605989 RepID=A0A517WAD0_9PLAN|nr:hypothetical protein V6x_19070 [Gimesia chilikensis]
MIDFDSFSRNLSFKSAHLRNKTRLPLRGSHVYFKTNHVNVRYYPFIKIAPGNQSFRGPVGTVCNWTVLLVQERVVSAGDAAEEVVEIVCTRQATFGDVQ